MPRPRYNRNGDVIGESLDASGADKALELLGKHLSLFTDNLNVRKIKSLEDLTDEEAVAIAKKIKGDQVSGVRDQEIGVRGQGSGIRDQGNQKPKTKNQKLKTGF